MFASLCGSKGICTLLVQWLWTGPTVLLYGKGQWFRTLKIWKWKMTSMNRERWHIHHFTLKSILVILSRPYTRGAIVEALGLVTLIFEAYGVKYSVDKRNGQARASRLCRYSHKWTRSDLNRLEHHVFCRIKRGLDVASCLPSRKAYHRSESHSFWT
jgi:hypothetical protein